MPTSVYSGQKLIKLVNAKITAKTPRKIANMPLILPLKYKKTIIAATASLIILSVLPMFFVMIFKKLMVRKKLLWQI